MARFTRKFTLTGSLLTAVLFALGLGWNAMHCARFGAGMVLVQLQADAVVSLADCHTANPEDPQNQDDRQAQPSQGCPYCQTSHGLALQVLPQLELPAIAPVAPSFAEVRQTAPTRSSQKASRAPPALA